MKPDGAAAIGLVRSAPRYAVGAIMIAIMLLVNVEVAIRFVFNLPLDALSEIVLLLFPWLSLLGAAVAVDTGAHMALHLLDQRLPDRAKVGVRVFVGAVTAGFGIFLIVQGINYATMRHGEMTNVLSISRSWEVVAFPVSGALIVLYSLRAVALLRRRNVPLVPDLGSAQF